MELNRVFWRVKTVSHEDGKEVFLSEKAYEEKPKDRHISKQDKDVSIRYFESKEEAELFYNHNKESKPAAKKKNSPVLEIRLLTFYQVAKILGVSHDSVNRMAKTNQILHHKVGGGCYRFDPSDVEHYLFLSKHADEFLKLNPKSIEELFQRMDNRHQQEKKYIEKLFKDKAKTIKKEAPMRK